MSKANVLYSPYGAYEQKAKYQKNFLTSNLIVTSFVILIILVGWIISVINENEGADAPAIVIRTIADLGPPPSVAKKPPQVQVQQPNIAAPKVGIPKPVADDEVVDEDVVLATRDELADIQAPDISSGSDVVVDIGDEDYMPSPDEFQKVEIQPDFISRKQPEYPRLAKQAGLSGKVWVKALVDKEGNVVKAIVGKTSGVQSLDDAAVAAAFENKFKPGIQNGRPVNCWVTYPVEFTFTK
ncbi:MAG: TonB family protein [Candidatus Zixiibacteriota bacterium]